MAPSTARPVLNRPLYRINDIREMFQVSRTTVYRWIYSGDLKVKKRGGSVIITAEALTDFLNSWEDNAA